MVNTAHQGRLERLLTADRAASALHETRTPQR